jgi:hypothetical protein
MPRWNISDPDRGPSPELGVTAERTRPQGGHEKPSAGQAGGRNLSTDAFGGEEQFPSAARSIAPESRTRYQDRDRTYSLRSSAMESMIDIGRFRTVDASDLAGFLYRGDVARMKQDHRRLREQGLIEQKTLFRANKSARRLVTLTELGQRIVTKAAGLGDGQRLYHGFVRPKELDHDADLYKVYQEAARRIQEQGGRPLRIRLDFELKESINRAREATKGFPDEERRILLAAAVRENGLTIEGTTIQLPDIQVEYETREGNIERENLELLSQHYGKEGIRGKAGAGFRMYARAAEAGRMRRALGDAAPVVEVLSA